MTFVQFILQLKLCLYTVVHLLLEEFKKLSQVIRKYTFMSYSWSRSLILGPESESHKKQGLHIPGQPQSVYRTNKNK